MQIYEIILIGVALSIDACALTLANCATYNKTLSKKRAYLMPVFFGLFQGVMPLIGYYVGSFFLGFLGEFIHYLVSIVFFLLASKIVIDVIKDRNCEKNEDAVCKVRKLSIFILLIQALATSIDALAAGVAFALDGTNIYSAITIIGLTTFALSFAGVAVGNKFGVIYQKKAEIAGGAVLVIIGIKILLEHFFTL
jgi:putative Mn2+ efflux pump MntP